MHLFVSTVIGVNKVTFVHFRIVSAHIFTVMHRIDFLFSEFLVGNRQMSLLPVTASIFMSFISALLVLGNTAEMYLYGGQFLLQNIGASLAYVATAVIVVPIIYPLKITSVFEVIHINQKIITTNIGYSFLCIKNKSLCFQ